jgi:hypothetical protein
MAAVETLTQPLTAEQWVERFKLGWQTTAGADSPGRPQAPAE